MVTTNLAVNKRATAMKKELHANDIFPSRVMYTFHPQRWTDKPGLWLKEFVMQNLKNVVKGLIVSIGR